MFIKSHTRTMYGPARGIRVQDFKKSTSCPKKCEQFRKKNKSALKSNKSTN